MILTGETITSAWGLLEYKPRWSLSPRGWSLLLFVLVTIFWFIVTRIHGFLALKAPIEADVLILEAWVGDLAAKGGAEEFKRGNYRYIITAGSPFHDGYKGFYLNEEKFSEYKNQADLTKATLVKLGIDGDRIVPVAIAAPDRDRTAAMAFAVKERLGKEKLAIRSVNIYSYDVHTRRSYLIYQKVLNPEIQVGAIAHPNPNYDPDRWWATSTGFRSVIEEAIAYVYARFFWRLS
jgi:hypothetical protein